MQNSKKSENYKKNIFIHVGIPKTGSSALQAYLSNNSNLFEKFGLSYPFPEESITVQHGTCIGNLMHVMIAFARNDGLRLSTKQLTTKYLPKAMEKAISSSNCNNILLSGEFIAEHLSEKMIEYFNVISKFHNVIFIAYVRDVYDQTLSSWKQKVKSDGEFRNFKTYVDDIISEQSASIKNISKIINSGLHLEAINYDQCKQNILESLFVKMNIKYDKYLDISQSSEKKNLSFSFWQASAVTLSEAQGASRAAAICIDLFRRHPILDKDPYFPDVDEKLLKFFSEDLVHLNRRLSDKEHLRTTPRKDFLKAEARFPTEVVAQIIECLERYSSPHENNINYTSDPRVPEDFDPLVYLLRNPDVARAKIDPVTHYLNHGQFEGRVYKSK